MSDHIRFLCPNCKVLMEAGVERAGNKIYCLECGQRLQIPPAELAQTILVPALAVKDEPSGTASGYSSVPTATFSSPMGKEWFYTKGDGKKLGPFSFAELQVHAKSGQLVSRDMVWKQGMAKWTAANAINGLFGNLDSTPSPSPAPLSGNLSAFDLQPAGATRAPLQNKNRWQGLHPAAKTGIIGGAALLSFICLALILGWFGGDGVTGNGADPKPGGGADWGSPIRVNDERQGTTFLVGLKDAWWANSLDFPRAPEFFVIYYYKNLGPREGSFSLHGGEI